MSQIVILSLINFWSGIYGVDSNIARSVAMHESHMNPNAVGALKEVGLFQIRPEFVKEYTRTQLFDPQTNIIVGIQKIKEAQRTCIHKKDIEFLVCYNFGNTNARKVKHPELFPYVKAVKRLMLADNKFN